MNNTTNSVDDVEGEGMKYYLKYWLTKLRANASKSFRDRKPLFDEALRYIPSSYKLWKMMFDQAFIFLNDRCIANAGYKELNGLFEVALVHLPQMPRIWIYYAKFLFKQGKYTKLLEVMDRALRNLSVTQHDKIWELYQGMLPKIKTVEIGKLVYRRYLKYDPTVIEDYIEYLLARNQYTEAVKEMLAILRDMSFYSKKNKSKYEYSMELSKLMAEKSKYINGIDCKEVFEYFLTKYTDEIGTLWIYYAEYYIQLGLFETARAVFDKALDTIKTLRDFSIIYNAYLRFEEELLNMYMEEDEQELTSKEIEIENKISSLFNHTSRQRHATKSNEELQLKRLEYLLERQPFLLNATKLRQNPNSVNDWMEKAELYAHNTTMYLNVFREAFKTIDAPKADGKLSELWIRLANHYKENNQLELMNITFEQSLKVHFRKSEEYIRVIRTWVECLLDSNYITDCVNILSTLLIDSRGPSLALNYNTKQIIRKSNSLWSFLADIHYNYGDFRQLESVYQKMIEHQVASPLNLLNYTNILISMQKFEGAFGVCETAIKNFAWPAAHHFWLLYLSTFERYTLNENNVERLRDLYARVLQEAPPSKSKLTRLDIFCHVCKI